MVFDGISRFPLGSVLTDENIAKIIAMDPKLGFLKQDRENYLRSAFEKDILSKVAFGNNFTNALEEILKYSWEPDDDFRENLVKQVLYLKIAESVNKGTDIEIINKVLVKVMRSSLEKSPWKELLLKSISGKFLPNPANINGILGAAKSVGISEDEFCNSARIAIKKEEDKNGITFQTFMISKNLGLSVSGEYADRALNVADNMLRYGSTQGALEFYEELSAYSVIGPRRQIIEAKNSEDPDAVKRAAILAGIMDKPVLSGWRKWLCNLLGAYE